MNTPLIEQFGNDKRWVSWKLQTRKGKQTKVPYSLSGKLASSIDVDTWSTYPELINVTKNIGIVFTPDQDLLGVDIDHCLEGDQVIHEESRNILQFLKESNTYCEVSPSNTGLHIFFKLSSPLKLISNKKAPYEIYTSGRYFTVTSKPFRNISNPVREVTPDEALKLLDIIGYPWGKKEELPISTTKVHVSMDDNKILEKMFASKNGSKIRSLYDGDISSYDDDASKADMSLCSHLAFWTRRDASQMERIWLSSALGQRKKTQERPAYRTLTVNAAIASCKEVYENQETKMIKEFPQGVELLFSINRTKDKVFIQNTENICRILRYHAKFQGKFRYDAFKNAMEYREEKGWRSFEDNDDVNIQTEISILFECFAKVTKQMVYDAMIKVAKENTIDSALDYVKSLIWDKKKRLDNWLHSVYGAPNDDYHKAVGSNVLKGMVKRIVEPGCKFDHVLVLEGPQGSRKSTSLSILGGDWHVETTMSTDNKDFFMQFQGKTLVEFSEGETMSRTEVKKMKAIITTQIDRYRAPWGKISQDFPRRCIFGMTTNQTEYLKDETGNRRWLPVALVLPEADTDWLIENREQLFAEAYHRVVALKESVHEFPREETERMQDARQIHDQNEDLVANWYFEDISEETRKMGITIHQVYKQALHGGMSSKIMAKYEEMSISNILKNHLRLISVQNRRNGVRSSRWYKNKEDAYAIDRDEALVAKDPLDVDFF